MQYLLNYLSYLHLKGKQNSPVIKSDFPVGESTWSGIPDAENSKDGAAIICRSRQVHQHPLSSCLLQGVTQTE